MTNYPKIKFCGGVGSVTGANFLLEVSDEMKILVDCGLVQGDKVAMKENREPFTYDLSEIKALFITHAHLDHVGRIPKLVKEGYQGPIYSTPETKALAEIVLTDAASILAMEAKQDGEEPLYDISDVEKVFPLWNAIPYHQNFELNDKVSVFFKDAGHILGSAMIEFSIKDTSKNNDVLRVLFTGDLGNSPAPLLRDTEAIGDANYLVMESVYGDRNHESKEGRINKFQKIIKDALDRGGTLVIPAFSIDRTQVLLYELNNMVEEGKIPDVPVYVDSPMAIKATEIYKSNTDLFNDHVKEKIANGDDIFQFPRLKFTVSSAESRNIKEYEGAKIILAGSGMSVGGRVIGHEEYFLPDPKNTILLVGYQSVGSLGRHLADGQKKVTIHKRTIKVKAHIETLYGFSAHRDSDHLVEFVSTGTDKLKNVFVVMGEPGASMHLAQRVNDELGVKAIVPDRDNEYTLS
ncbi:MAG: MBL fold metallo-hydrolase [Candidatus Paceibacterota bacterium]|jgi:metallo-beta-lactamase family protein